MFFFFFRKNFLSSFSEWFPTFRYMFFLIGICHVMGGGQWGQRKKGDNVITPSWTWTRRRAWVNNNTAEKGNTRSYTIRKRKRIVTSSVSSDLLIDRAFIPHERITVSTHMNGKCSSIYPQRAKKKRRKKENYFSHFHNSLHLKKKGEDEIAGKAKKSTWTRSNNEGTRV